MVLNDIKQINPVSKELVEIVYGDSVTGDTSVELASGSMPIEELFDYFSYSYREDRGKEFAKTDELVKLPNNSYQKILYVVRHKTNKQLYKITTYNGFCVTVTEDHSLMVCKSDDYNLNSDIFHQLKELSPKKTSENDYMMCLNGVCQIETIENLGSCDDYVYDICVDTDDEYQHVFFANGILVHNTDSLYISYDGLLNTIEGIENWSIEQKTEFIVKLNQEFLDQHNRDFMAEYYKSRHVESVQNFELETIALSGVWLDVKKRYAQILLWKDGKTFDKDNLPMKIKGLEMVKSSYPKQARESLKRLVRYLLEDKSGDFLLQKMNIKMLEEKNLFWNADLEDICGNVGVQNYTKYIIDDTNPMGLQIAPKTPYNVRALGNYNWIRNVHKLSGDPIYGGKVKWYCYYPGGVKSKKGSDPEYFAFQSRNYPKWADKYAPISKEDMFRRTILDPFNRILSAIGIGELNLDGSIQMTLF